ncbi:MAG: thiamine pyrophosphate-binding protein [Desulfobacterales bacterium]
MRKTAGHGLLEMLIAHGVEYIFGNPGTTELPIMDGLQDYADLKYILSLQEASAVAMADGYARASGKCSFANLHIAGGLANGISMLYNAYRGGTPLILTAGQSDTRMLVEEPLLSGDLVEMCRQYSKWSGEVRHATDVPVAIRRAFRTALTPPTGPVFLSLPWNVLDEEADLDLTPASPVYARMHPDAEALERAAGLLAGAENLLMLVGDRVAQAGAVSEAVRVAEILGARVAAAIYSEVNFPTDHPQFRGLLNLNSPTTSEIFRRSDVILAVGCNIFSRFLYLPPLLSKKIKLVHLDVNAWEIEKNHPVEVGIWGDIKIGLKDLSEALGQTMSGAQQEAAGIRASKLAEAKAQLQASYLEEARQAWDRQPMDPARLFLEMKEVLPKNTIIVSEAITSTLPLFRAMTLDEPGSFFSLRGGALGWAIGGALGIQLAKADCPVVCIVGEGSAMYGIQGLWTAAYYDLPVTYVICNNRSYRILKQFLINYYYPALGLEDRQSDYIGMNFSKHPLDCAGVARGFGIEGFRVDKPGQLRATMEKALSLGRPSLVDVHIHSGDF